MKKLIALLCLLPLPALATCTWTQQSTQQGKVVCTTVGEAAFTDASSALLGWMASSCSRGVNVFVCADSSQTFTAVTTFSVYVYDPIAQLWGVYPDQNMTTTTGARCQQFDGKWTVVPEGRWAILPTAGTVSSGGATVYFRCN